MVEVEKDSIIALSCKRGQNGSCIEKLNPNPGGFDEEFYSNGFKGRVTDNTKANTGSQVASFVNLMSFSDSSNLASGDFLAASPLISNCLELREVTEAEVLPTGNGEQKKASRPSRSTESFSD